MFDLSVVAYDGRWLLVDEAEGTPSRLNWAESTTI